MSAREFNFDGLVGPTHNYSGLSFGNVASRANGGAWANPKLAALQGLAKMRALYDRGFAQGALRALGFAGNEREVLARAAREAPLLLSACSSASSMGSANAATVSASADTADARVHFTPANLNSKFHRSLEPRTTSRVLKAIFPDEGHFAHHAPLASTPPFGDEGAANHTRLAHAAGTRGVEFFVYGASGLDCTAPAPKRFPARQTREASEAVARLHALDPVRTVYAQQHPDAIDAGVFHNDVIAVGSARVLFCHARAFLGQHETLARLHAAFGEGLEVIEVPDAEVSVAEAVQTYLFNSQLLEREDGTMLIVVPEECRRHDRVRACLDNLVTRGTAIREWISFDLRESMRNRHAGPPPHPARGRNRSCASLRQAVTAEKKHPPVPSPRTNGAKRG